MKAFSRIFLLLALLAAGTACARKEVPPEQAATLLMEKNLVRFGTGGGRETVALTASGRWTSRSEALWCRAVPAEGEGNASVEISAEPNEAGRRTASFVFSSAGCRSVELVVAQEGKEQGPVTGRTGLYADPEVPDADGPCTLYYRAPAGSVFFGWSSSLYAHIGIVDGDWLFVPARWEENLDRCRWRPAGEADLWKLELSPSVRAWFGSGETPISRLGVVVRSADGRKQTEDLFLKVTDRRYRFVPDKPELDPVPPGMEYGVNCRPEEGAATFVLYDRDAAGKAHDYCYLLGAFSGWERQAAFLMKRDEAKGCWWYTLEGLERGREYLFQYHLGDEDGTSVRLTDPYSERIYDPQNDPSIPPSVYPGLTACPPEARGLVSAFTLGEEPYSWEVPDWKIPDPDNLLIYELLLRDFTQEGDLAGATGKLDRLAALGVNAVELMPVQEFDGNDSWGYNPNHYFALDKAYGPERSYRRFIDECHRRNLAVILDVVYDHATAGHPLARLYAEGGRVTPQNPWFNVEAPHPYGVFLDWNHENEQVRAYFRRNLKFLLEEYHFDGFRFDLSKGLTQRHSTEATAAGYDASRIAILKDYHSAVKAANPAAVVILEHFCEDREEKELAAAGMKVWRKLSGPYGQAAMGFPEQSGFSDLWTGANGMAFGGYVGYMESHDEERTAYKSLKWGKPGIRESLDVRMKREALNAAFFLLVPGPKLIWQFGEYGYDISIDFNGRTGRKPVKWEWAEVPERKRLHEVYAGLLAFRSRCPELFGPKADFEWKVSASDWEKGRYIRSACGGKAFALVGNFTLEDKIFRVEFGRDGKWRNYFAPEEVYSGENADIAVPCSGFKLFVNF